MRKGQKHSPESLAKMEEYRNKVKAMRQTNVSLRHKPKIARTVRAEAIRDKIIDMIQEQQEPLIAAQIKAALGEVVLTRTNEKGEIATQSTMPDTQAARFLFEQAIGRPKEMIEHSGAIGLVALVAKLNQEQEEYA